MSRTSFTGRLATALAAASALAVAACSDVPVQPDAAGPAPTSPALAKAPAEDDVVAGEVIVKLKDDAALDASQLAPWPGQGPHRLWQGVRDPPHRPG